ncbi:unnamed protein product, partial [Musa hybrid cultivar]
MDQTPDIEIQGKEGLHDRSSVQLLTTSVAEEPAALLTEALGVRLRAPRLLEFWTAARTPPPEPVHLEPRQSKNQQRAAAGVYACAGLQPSNKRRAKYVKENTSSRAPRSPITGLVVSMLLSQSPSLLQLLLLQVTSCFTFSDTRITAAAFAVKRRTSRRGHLS